MHNENHPVEFNPVLIVALLIGTFGVFAIFWIYLKNKEFEQLKSSTIDSSRALAVLFILPIVFASILWILYLYSTTLIFTISLYLLLPIIGFFILKYLLDFSCEAATLSKTNPLIWFIPFCISFAGVFIIMFQYPTLYAIPFLIIPFFHIPLLQHFLNVCYRNLKHVEEKKKIYS